MVSFFFVFNVKKKMSKKIPLAKFDIYNYICLKNNGLRLKTDWSYLDRAVLR